MILWGALIVAALVICFGAGYGFHAWREPRARGELIDLTGRRP